MIKIFLILIHNYLTIQLLIIIFILLYQLNYMILKLIILNEPHQLLNFTLLHFLQNFILNLQLIINLL